MSTPTTLHPPRVELGANGNPERAWLPSTSQPGVIYEMVRTGSGWTHTSTECRGWVERGTCYHIAALEGLMNEQTDETHLTTVEMNPLALLDDLDLEQVMTEKLIPSAHHIYSFKQKGETVEGVSIDGVRDAARALSSKGEAIREQWVRLEREDEKEAYFIACAARYAVAPDGREICMDTAIRAKRQPKFGKKREGGEYFIEAWYEIGVAKAVRNATEALLPEAMKDYIKAQAKALISGKPANGAAPAMPSAYAQANKALRELKDTTDAGWFRDLLVQINEQWPGCLSAGGQLMINAAASEHAEAIWAWLKETHVDATAESATVPA